MNIIEFANVLANAGCHPHKSHNGYQARCPAHEDNKPSLSISTDNENNILIYCHAGCTAAEVMAALNLRLADLYNKPVGEICSRPQVIVRYDYRNTSGDLIYQVERLQPKGFRQRRPDGTGGWIYNMDGIDKIPYRLPELLQAVADNQMIFIVEGEKDVDYLRGQGAEATCNSGGAGKWQESFAKYFKGATVVILPDKDEPGKKHAEAVATSLAAVAKKVYVVTLPGLPDKGDITDWLELGHELGDLHDLVEQTQPWEAGTKPSSYAKSSSLADVKPEKVSWLWHAHIPLGKLTVLDGDPGLGKSTITVDIAARLSTAQEMPDGSRGDLDAPSSTILITAEDGLGDTVQPRALAAGADLNYIHAITGVVTSEGSTDWQMPDHLNELEALVNEKTAKLIIIDPLMAMLSANVNTYRDQDIRRVLRGLAELADRSGAAVVVVRHLTKSSGANGLYRGSGSIGIIGAARSGLLVAHNPDDEDTCIMASTKSNLAEMPPAIAYRLVPHNDTSKVEWLGTTDHKVADILQVTDPEERSALEDAEEWLSGILAFEPVPATTIFKTAAAVGYSAITIRRAKSKLGVVAKQEGRQWIWSLPTTTESDKSDGQGISDGQTA